MTELFACRGEHLAHRRLVAYVELGTRSDQDLVGARLDHEVRLEILVRSRHRVVHQLDDDFVRSLRTHGCSSPHGAATAGRHKYMPITVSPTGRRRWLATARST